MDITQWHTGIHMRTLVFVCEPCEEGGFHGYCPQLPGLHTQGDTIEECELMIADALGALLESYAADERPVPWVSGEAESVGG